MGGIFITIGVLAAAIIFLSQTGSYLWYAVIGATAFGLIGFIDDLIKVLKHRSLGLKPYQKIVAQVVFAALVSVYAYQNPAIGSSLYVPILDTYWDLGIWYIPFTMFVIIAMTNSANLTDGLDGLAGSVTLVSAATFTLILFPFIEQTVWGEDMAVFAAAFTGAILAFLRYNAYPAKVFMGDVGSFFGRCPHHDGHCFEASAFAPGDVHHVCRFQHLLHFAGGQLQAARRKADF